MFKEIKLFDKNCSILPLSAASEESLEIKPCFFPIGCRPLLPKCFGLVSRIYYFLGIDLDTVNWASCNVQPCYWQFIFKSKNLLTCFLHVFNY